MEHLEKQEGHFRISDVEGKTVKLFTEIMIYMREKLIFIFRSELIKMNLEILRKSELDGFPENTPRNKSHVDLDLLGSVRR